MIIQSNTLRGVARMITRRTVTQGLTGLGVAAAFGSLIKTSYATATGAQPVVKTSLGTVRGSVTSEVCRFLGIPYGAPTGGSARFMPPRPAAPWSGIREAQDFGDSCPQVPLGVSPFARRGPNDPPLAPNPVQQQLMTFFSRRNPEPKSSEECLVLNIWTPATDGAKRPVMVWLHGGGFAVGSGSSPTYDGAHLAKRGDVVVVTINHRLNVFGHLYLGEVAGEAFAQSGNVGMLDVVAALKWVGDNIAQFGGNPHNVTIFGESGGAGKVSVICGMPAAKGLFHKAIMQSGPCLQIADKARGTAIARQLLKDLGISADQAASLQNIDAMKLSAAADAAETKVVPRVLGFGPSGMIPLVDGVSITHHPFDKEAAPESAHVPFLVGSTQDEAVLFVAPFPKWGQFTDSEIIELAKPMAGARAADAVELYKKLHPQDNNSYLLVDIVTDYWMRQAAWQVATLKAKQKAAPAFVYVMQWPVNADLRTPHGTDNFMVFDNINTSPAIEHAAHAQQVADQMSAAWVAFARTGSPNSAHLVKWPAYSLDTRANMLFNVQSRVVDDFDKSARQFWESAS
jgi:para-nitrobenzyl esterase